MSELPERFWAKVDKTDSCWNWTACINEHGYGRFSWQGGPLLAHRVAYSVLVEEISAGLQIDHKCHNSLCVNPDHLQPVSHGENQENRASARADSGTGVRGVYWNRKRRLFEAYATHDGVKHQAGHFADLVTAGNAARALRNKLHKNNLVDRSAA